jgi:hypothetical protein
MRRETVDCQIRSELPGVVPASSFEIHGRIEDYPIARLHSAAQINLVATAIARERSFLGLRPKPLPERSVTFGLTDYRVPRYILVPTGKRFYE